MMVNKKHERRAACGIAYGLIEMAQKIDLATGDEIVFGGGDEHWRSKIGVKFVLDQRPEEEEEEPDSTQLERSGGGGGGECAEQNARPVAEPEVARRKTPGTRSARAGDHQGGERPHDASSQARHRWRRRH